MKAGNTHPGVQNNFAPNARDISTGADEAKEMVIRMLLFGDCVRSVIAYTNVESGHLEILCSKAGYRAGSI